MKNIFLVLILVSLLFPVTSFAQVVQAYFYNNGTGDKSFKTNYKSIDVVSPQVYYIDYDFDLKKTNDKGVIKRAHNKKVKVVPLVFQQDFSRTLMSKILAAENIQNDIIDDLIDEAQDEDYAGWQFDFEYISSADRNAYTKFVEKAGKEFKKANLEFSVAVIPRTTPYNPKAINQDLTAAYDYEKLAEAADYLVAMAYNDPNSFGPTGSLLYQQAVLDFMTTIVPKNKLQLGIAFYCSKWRLSGGYKQFGELSHDDVKDDIDKSQLLLQGYIEGLESEYSAYIVPSGNAYLTWCDGPAGFRAKLKLVDKYNLRGISLWALGQENKDMWDSF